jgi:hypothetical protein
MGVFGLPEALGRKNGPVEGIRQPRNQLRVLISFYTVMYEGYSFMESGYACVFDGKEISEKCDYGIKLDTYQVVLPESIRTFPLSCEEGEFSDSKWVRKKPFLAYLASLQSRN